MSMLSFKCRRGVGLGAEDPGPTLPSTSAAPPPPPFASLTLGPLRPPAPIFELARASAVERVNFHVHKARVLWVALVDPGPGAGVHHLKICPDPGHLPSHRLLEMASACLGPLRRVWRGTGG